MPTLPWTVNEEPDPESAAVVFGSKLGLQSFRHVPGFLRTALRLRRQLREAPGLYGVSLVAQPTRRTFWTLSAWRDDDTLDAFVATTEHQAVMRRYHDRMSETAFTKWAMAAAALPAPRSNAKALWVEARARLADAE